MKEITINLPASVSTILECDEKITIDNEDIISINEPENYINVFNIDINLTIKNKDKYKPVFGWGELTWNNETGELSYPQKVGNIEIVEYDSKGVIFKKTLWYGCRLYDYKKNASNFTLFFNVGWRNVVFL